MSFIYVLNILVVCLSRNGGWILDDFPRNRDQWTVMIERNVLPDEIVLMKDSSDNGDFLVKRWYQLNRDEVDETIRVRREKEAEEKKRLEEEAR